VWRWGVKYCNQRNFNQIWTLHVLGAICYLVRQLLPHIQRLSVIVVAARASLQYAPDKSETSPVERWVSDQHLGGCCASFNVSLDVCLIPSVTICKLWWSRSEFFSVCGHCCAGRSSFKTISPRTRSAHLYLRHVHLGPFLTDRRPLI
jgi:hypothetical protein